MNLAGSTDAWSVSAIAFRGALTAAPPAPTKLAFTTAAQTLDSWTCSGITTVQAQNASNQPVHVSTTRTINLSGSGITYYEDDSCNTPISSIDIYPGKNSRSFYFIAANPSSTQITASSAGLTSANQTETINQNAIIWQGGPSCDGNWSTAACWTGNAAPGPSDVAHFDDLCTTNCSPTTDSAVSIGGLWLHANYTGTITQGPHAFDIGVPFGYRQEGGTFTGSTSPISLIMTWPYLSPFYLSGGTFNSTSSTLTVGGDFTVTGTGTFNPNNGLLVIDPGNTQTVVDITPGTVNYNNVTFYAGNIDCFVIRGTMNINGHFYVDNPANGLKFCGVSTSVINARGDVTVDGGLPENGSSGVTTLNINGNGNQTITGLGTGEGFPYSINIANTGSGSGAVVSLVGNIKIDNWVYTSGTVDAGTSTVWIGASWGGDLNTGSMHFNHLNLNSWWWDANIYGTGTIYVDGNLTIDNDASVALIGGTYSVAGNVILAGSDSDGTASITFRGANAQTYTRTGGSLPNGDVVVNKTSGTTLTLNNNMTLLGDLTISSGTLNMNTRTMTVPGDLTITDTLLGGTNTLTVGGNWYNQGTFTAGTGTVTFNGVGAFTIGGLFATTFNNLTFNNNSGSWLQAFDTTINGNLTLTNGTVNSNGYNVTLGGNFTKSGTYTSGNNTFTLMSGVNHTFSGQNISFYNLTMDDSGNSAADTLTFVSGRTYTVTNILTLRGNATNTLKLRASSAGTQWRISPSLPLSAVTTCLDVKDSNNLNATNLNANGGTGSCYVDSLNNTKWSFP